MQKKKRFTEDNLKYTIGTYIIECFIKVKLKKVCKMQKK